MSNSRIGGTLIPPGSHPSNQVGGKVYIPAASYPSKSNPTKGYTVCEVNDGNTGCDCMGWTRRNPPGGRTCRHTQDYELTLRDDWNALNNGLPIPHRLPRQRASIVGATLTPEPVVQVSREKGGALSDLFAKLDKENS